MSDAYLKEEYFQLQKVVEDFDARSLTIKAWSVTFSAAGLGLAYAEHEPGILLLASLSALVFWVTEALWKTNQQAFYQRVQEIEDHFSGGGPATTPFRIGHSWGAQFRAHGGYRRSLSIMWWLHVMLPHVAVVIAGIALFVLLPPNAPVQKTAHFGSSAVEGTTRAIA